LCAAGDIRRSSMHTVQIGGYLIAGHMMRWARHVTAYPAVSSGDDGGAMISMVGK
jgi:hypothetical protein